MARVFFTFNPLSVLLAIGVVVIGIPAALIMLTSWFILTHPKMRLWRKSNHKSGPSISLEM